MKKEEFIQEAKKLGYTDEEIQEWVEIYEDAKKKGVTMDWRDFLIEKPFY